MADSRGHTLFQKDDASKGKFAFTTEDYDMFEVCFHSTVTGTYLCRYYHVHVVLGPQVHTLRSCLDLSQVFGRLYAHAGSSSIPSPGRSVKQITIHFWHCSRTCEGSNIICHIGYFWYHFQIVMEKVSTFNKGHHMCSVCLSSSCSNCQFQACSSAAANKGWLLFISDQNLVPSTTAVEQ